MRDAGPPGQEDAILEVVDHQQSPHFTLYTRHRNQAPPPAQTAPTPPQQDPSPPPPPPAHDHAPLHQHQEQQPPPRLLGPPPPPPPPPPPTSSQHRAYSAHYPPPPYAPPQHPPPLHPPLHAPDLYVPEPLPLMRDPTCASSPVAVSASPASDVHAAKHFGVGSHLASASHGEGFASDSIHTAAAWDDFSDTHFPLHHYTQHHGPRQHTEHHEHHLHTQHHDHLHHTQHNDHHQHHHHHHTQHHDHYHASPPPQFAGTAKRRATSDTDNFEGQQPRPTARQNCDTYYNRTLDRLSRFVFRFAAAPGEKSVTDQNFLSQEEGIEEDLEIVLDLLSSTDGSLPCSVASANGNVLSDSAICYEDLSVFAAGHQSWPMKRVGSYDSGESKRRNSAGLDLSLSDSQSDSQQPPKLRDEYEAGSRVPPRATSKSSSIYQSEIEQHSSTSPGASSSSVYSPQPSDSGCDSYCSRNTDLDPCDSFGVEQVCKLLEPTDPAAAQAFAHNMELFSSACNELTKVGSVPSLYFNRLVDYYCTAQGLNEFRSRLEHERNIDFEWNPLHEDEDFDENSPPWTRQENSFYAEVRHGYRLMMRLALEAAGLSAAHFAQGMEAACAAGLIWPDPFFPPTKSSLGLLRLQLYGRADATEFDDYGTNMQSFKSELQQRMYAKDLLIARRRMYRQALLTRIALKRKVTQIKAGPRLAVPPEHDVSGRWTVASRRSLLEDSMEGLHTALSTITDSAFGSLFGAAFSRSNATVEIQLRADVVTFEGVTVLFAMPRYHVNLDGSPTTIYPTLELPQETLEPCITCTAYATLASDRTRRGLLYTHKGDTAVTDTYEMIRMARAKLNDPEAEYMNPGQRLFMRWCADLPEPPPGRKVRPQVHVIHFYYRVGSKLRSDDAVLLYANGEADPNLDLSALHQPPANAFVVSRSRSVYRPCTEPPMSAAPADTAPVPRHYEHAPEPLAWDPSC